MCASVGVSFAHPLTGQAANLPAVDDKGSFGGPRRAGSTARPLISIDVPSAEKGLVHGRNIDHQSDLCQIVAVGSLGQAGPQFLPLVAPLKPDAPFLDLVFQVGLSRGQCLGGQPDVISQ